MISGKIRQKFLEFFKNKEHIIVPSSSLIPDDLSVLLTSAGMQQFKPYYLGEKSPFGNRVATIQKCFRTSDIEEVGDESHLTFFEMLGNFAFNNNYFKKETIKWGYEFLIKEMEISEGRIYATVFEGDENTPFDKESYEVLRALGLDERKIKKSGRKDNFWGPTGSEGPCGPTVEFYVDGMEVWNLVFNEYFCAKDGSLTSLGNKGVDTGMGLERLAKVMQGVETVFETDLFALIIDKLQELSEKCGTSDVPHRKYVRIIADHMRGSVFLIGDGVLPSNTERGYILRRLLRRAIRYGKLLELSENWLADAVKTIIENYKEYYSELARKENEIIEVVKEESEKFGRTLDNGLKILEENAESWIKSFQDLPFKGGFAFELYETYGFPPEMTLEELQKYPEIKKRQNFEKEYWNYFKKCLNDHQEKSRASLEKKFGGHGLIMDTGELKAGSEEDIIKVTSLHTATHLLHQALREVLGGHIKQMGSDINSERLRFDFTHTQKITPEELQKIENIVNEKIKEDLEVKMEEMPYNKAVESGALAFFKGKYPKVVKVYSVGGSEASSGQVFSKEVCGGPHASRTGELGKFKIKKEESSSAGVRRIKAVLE